VRFLRKIEDEKHYNLWKLTNVIPQKQKDSMHRNQIHLAFFTDKARYWRFGSKICSQWIAPDLAPKFNTFCKAEYLLSLYRTNKLVMRKGYNGIFDITSCPGTDTCNWECEQHGITENWKKVEKWVSQLADNKEITIKISGCMNSCGQHTWRASVSGNDHQSGNWWRRLTVLWRRRLGTVRKNSR